MDTTMFVDLLAKHRMTFFWGAIDKKWWIIGQIENGCVQNTPHLRAENFDAAQAAALKYIQQKYPTRA